MKEFPDTIYLRINDIIENDAKIESKAPSVGYQEAIVGEYRLVNRHKLTAAVTIKTLD